MECWLAYSKPRWLCSTMALAERTKRKRKVPGRGAKLTEKIVREVLYNDFIYGYDHFY